MSRTYSSKKVKVVSSVGETVSIEIDRLQERIAQLTQITGGAVKGSKRRVSATVARSLGDDDDDDDEEEDDDDDDDDDGDDEAYDDDDDGGKYIYIFRIDQTLLVNLRQPYASFIFFYADNEILK
jgi:ABC-type Zn2+ transport system substrate-binding protein/surface adhesin